MKVDKKYIFESPKDQETLADRFEGSAGHSLRGFYVDDKRILERPSIWVNVAREPVGVAAAFWHEVGHHLTRRIFVERRHADLS